MIYLVDRRNRAAFNDQLEEMYRQRHQVYVEKRGWKALARPDKREIDQFDNEDAVYLMKISDAGKVQGAVRLIQTTKPHLMRDVFSHIVTLAPVPDDPKIFEMTRCYVSDDIGGKQEKAQAAGEVMAAMEEYGLARGITDYSVVSDLYFVPFMTVIGDGVKSLGVPYEYGEGTCVAMSFPVNERGLRICRRARGLDDSGVLVFSDTPPPQAMADKHRIGIAA
ncbi:MAG TPA: acyl-homoserine-lactone synthase [Rhizomicrobium sp.]|nr:acyl-homoserine-lactone synthase [Rhizomicrobium sp.]